MASLQSDLANQEGSAADSFEVAAAASSDCRVKLNRRSLGGLAFDVEFIDDSGQSNKTDNSDVKSSVGGGKTAVDASPSRKAQQPPQSTAVSADEIAERLAAAELRREQQLAERVGRLETKLSHVTEVAERQKREVEARTEQNLKSVEETLKAAEERRLGRMEEVKQRARGLSAGAKERSKAVREKLEAERQTLEAELDRDIRAKEAKRREQIERIVQGAQQHLAKVEGVRNQRLSTGPEQGCGDTAGTQSE
ncbi:hypothetical protein BOX15_Mlig006966g1 [Macrostomum lignano]|uniref:Stathmin n=1 Tax=Macrostomum lignano TaxID=282301 RepID=A0A267GXX2_9PLAT|nr:hypothetical protein BOX15_Mlig006966g2 [Macrostomum lignano]PAA90866.1 hypothetical protein BOX15_Mlig006966g1 [Macrostomum lignano]